MKESGVLYCLNGSESVLLYQSLGYKLTNSSQIRMNQFQNQQYVSKPLELILGNAAPSINGFQLFKPKEELIC